MELAPAIDRATRAATISVTRRGAQPSIPWREEIDRFETWFEEHRL
jgi:ribokinase